MYDVYGFYYFNDDYDSNCEKCDYSYQTNEERTECREYEYRVPQVWVQSAASMSTECREYEYRVPRVYEYRVSFFSCLNLFNCWITWIQRSHRTVYAALFACTARKSATFMLMSLAPDFRAAHDSAKIAAIQRMKFWIFPLVVCPAGYYLYYDYDKYAYICTECPEGQYTYEPNEYYCTACPNGYTTLVNEATSEEFCGQSKVSF